MKTFLSEPENKIFLESIFNFSISEIFSSLRTNPFTNISVCDLSEAGPGAMSWKPLNKRVNSLKFSENYAHLRELSACQRKFTKVTITVTVIYKTKG